jgi:S1-C subfamily serine protease
MALLDELAGAANDVATRVGASVVGIRGKHARGSGVVLGTDRVLTNAHNLGGEEIRVVFTDGRVETGRAVAVDGDGDLAVVEVATGDATPVEWGDDGPALGQPVFALANPGGRGLRVSFGVVSSSGQAFRGPRGRRIAGGFEHTAPLPRGSSGGPVVDAGGRLVGLNTHRLSESLYLAVPADAGLRQRADALGRGEAPERRSLGVGLVPGHAARHLRRAVGLADRDGVLVRMVEEGGPADRAGVRAGDLISAAGGQAVAGIDDLHAALEGAGDTLVLSLVRGVEELEVTVTFGE